ncbi:MAG: patatin-like phospholipase family protein [Nitrospirota bacterium]|nr:patatin-like phospholipase family protein [Nitrospirota bacterium]
MDIKKILSYFSKTKEGPQPKIALVLGGGSARGFAHIGVIRVLEKENIPVDMIIGTSVGSLIGAIYAYDVNSFELEWSAFSLERDDIFDYGLVTAFTGMGAAKGEKLEAFVRSKIPIENIEDLKIPFAAVATDLKQGKRVVLDRGPVARAVRASCAIPGVFQPVEQDGRLLVDGGVVDNIPVSVARERGADIIIAVDIGVSIENNDISNLFEVVLQSIQIMAAENVKVKAKEADVLISPALGKVGMMDFSKKKLCMQAGIEATQKALPAIKDKIDAWRRS